MALSSCRALALLFPDMENVKFFLQREVFWIQHVSKYSSPPVRLPGDWASMMLTFFVTITTVELFF